jgi:hypothetical protein
MKLFQQMLVAGAAVSLIAPLAAQASDVNLDGMNSYSRSKSSKRIDSKTFINEVSEDLAILKGRVDGLEAQQNNFEAGSFSETTTLDGKVAFSVGAIEDGDGVPSDSGNGEALMAAYMYQANLNTSFTGDDNLYVRIKAGNAADWMKSTTYGTYLSSAKGSTDALAVDKIWYTFPVGEKNTVWIGPKIENYYMHATTPSIYQPVTKQFTLGGNGAAYGASTNSGVGWAYNADNGFAVSSNVVSKTAGSDTGFLTNQSATSWATQVGFTKPQYSASIILNQKYNGWTDSYFSTATGLSRSTGTANGNSSNIGLRGWWRPADSGTATPSVSVGFDTSNIDAAAANASTTTAYFVGLNWSDMFQADDKIGLALGQPQKNESETTDPFAWEAYYSFQVNESVTVTPTVFGTTNRDSTTTNDVTGFVVDTVFKF